MVIFSPGGIKNLKQQYQEIYLIFSDSIKKGNQAELPENSVYKKVSYNWKQLTMSIMVARLWVMQNIACDQ